jgi:hypothetical protein
MMNGPEKSDSAIVATKPANKEEPSVERSAGRIPGGDSKTLNRNNAALSVGVVAFNSPVSRRQLAASAQVSLRIDRSFSVAATCGQVSQLNDAAKSGGVK